MKCLVCNYENDMKFFKKYKLSEMRLNECTIKYEPYSNDILYACPYCGNLRVFAEIDTIEK